MAENLSNQEFADLLKRVEEAHGNDADITKLRHEADRYREMISDLLREFTDGWELSTLAKDAACMVGET